MQLGSTAAHSKARQHYWIGIKGKQGDRVQTGTHTIT
jgi:hypothetical protein